MKCSRNVRVLLFLDFVFQINETRTESKRKVRPPLMSALFLYPLAQYHNLVCVGMSRRRSLKQIKADRLMEVVYSFLLRTG